MFDGLPPDIPALSGREAPLVQACIERAAHDYGIHTHLIQAILKVEGGKVGTMSRNTNGSYDLGPMQINTLWLKEVAQYKVSKDDLKNNPCVNIYVGTWILSNKISEAGDVWKGVGNYHSKTPRFHKRYLAKVVKAYRDIVAYATARRAAGRAG